MSSIVVHIYHNRKTLSSNDIESFFVPIFGDVYSYEILFNMSDHTWSAYIDDQLIGCLLVQEIRPSMIFYILLFGIEQTYRSLGIGTRLLSMFIRFGEKKFFQKIFLHTESSNRYAIDFYRKFHFHVDQSIENYYRSMPKFSRHAYRMVRLFDIS